MNVGCKPMSLDQFLIEALIGQSAGRIKRVCIETSKDFGSSRIMVGSLTAFEPLQRPLATF